MNFRGVIFMNNLFYKEKYIRPRKLIAWKAFWLT
jgi:hypothetical protein